jgi:pyruvate,water dikinase
MLGWLKRQRNGPQPAPPRYAEERIREKYLSFQNILNLNTECLELMAGLQEDLQYVPPLRDIVEDRIAGLFERTHRILESLRKLGGEKTEELAALLENLRREVERHVAGLQELAAPRLAVWLSQVGLEAIAEVGGKAAYLGEIKRKLGLPVPEGFVLTTEAYRQFCGIPCWRRIRDALRQVDPENLESLRAASRQLQAMVMEIPMPRGVEVALVDWTRALRGSEAGLVVRSSAVGEGGERTYAGQYLSLLNVPPGEVVAAYRRVIAARFSEQALSYRLSTGLLEVDSPMAVLILPLIRARAAGILYTRDPADPYRHEVWITATRGLGPDLASGRVPADLYILSRKRGHKILRAETALQAEQIVPRAGGGTERRPLAAETLRGPSLSEAELAALADYAVAIEKHFGGPQDIEWAVDQEGAIWILQSRPLAVVRTERERSRVRPRGEPVLTGGVTIYPGRVSGQAFVAGETLPGEDLPQNSILFIRRAAPEIVKLLPRVSGVVAQWGNVAGHAAAVLREFRVPSVFLMENIFDRIQTGETVSLDAAARKVYRGAFWEPRTVEKAERNGEGGKAKGLIGEKILTLTLLDPAAHSFRPSGCKSVHDVLRYAHEKAVEAMFLVNDLEMEKTGHAARQIKMEVPLNIYVLDLGGGLAEEAAYSREVEPGQILCRPFQSLWKGVTHPGVSWKRQIPARFSDLASLVASSFSPQTGAMRALGMRSYLLVAREYMNLNSRLAYHYSLVDSCLCDDPVRNYISFRFAGGGSTRYRRNLRAYFLEACLRHYGYTVQRRGDLVNAWMRKIPPEEADFALDILGRLLACACQLDMYMDHPDTMQWFVEQFLRGNYAFEEDESLSGASH